MNPITEQDKLDWVKYPIDNGKRFKFDDSKVVEETLTNGKTYVLHQAATKTQYVLVGVK